jgi:hypothetical protein
VESWDDLTRWLAGHTSVPTAQASARLLRQAKPSWFGRVVPHSRMHDLTFTRPGDEYPFDECLNVSWWDGVYTLVLMKSPGVVITADKCTEGNIDALLTALLSQLARTDPGDSIAPRGHSAPSQPGQSGWARARNAMSRWFAAMRPSRSSTRTAG